MVFSSGDFRIAAHYDFQCIPIPTPLPTGDTLAEANKGLLLGSSRKQDNFSLLNRSVSPEIGHIRSQTAYPR